ncbi:Spindle associated [Penicillium soppii]|uniref:Spindle associated n=1 Tax=Penicillium soppii TaxID=69789 RepID=UPI002548FBE3|nr:Spindle associated [Penicillium soppii]KAJ5864350.1 Spindle associated [Penicillium soppii]
MMDADSSIEAGSESVETQTLDSQAVTTPTPSSAFQTPDQTLNADISSIYFMAEDSQSEYAQPSEPDYDPDFTMTSAQLDLDDHSFISSITERDNSSLFHPSSENGDERANNQTLIEEHEMRRKLMDIESSFLPEPSTIDVAAAGPVAGADDTYLVGVPKEDVNTTQDSSQPSFTEPEMDLNEGEKKEPFPP